MANSNQNVNIILSAINKSKEAFSQVQGSFNKMQYDIDQTRTKLESMKPAFQKMAAVGTVALAGIVAVANKTMNSASDLGESVNAVNVVFGESADKILEFGKTAAQTVGLSNSAFNQLATNTGALLMKTGISMDEVATKTQDLAIRAADMASVFNTDVNDAMSAINQALRGETEAIRKYTGDVTDASLQTFALSKGITKAVTEMTQEEKVLLRLDKVMADTSVTQGDFAATANEVANAERIMKAETENLSAAIGTSLLPIKKQLLEAVKPLIEQFALWAKENPDLVKNLILVGGAIAALVAVLGTLGLILPPLMAMFAIMTGPAVAGFIAMAAPILAVIALLWIIYETYSYIFENWNEHLENIKWAWGLLTDYLSEKWTMFVEWFQENWHLLFGFLGIQFKLWQLAFKAVTDFFKNNWQGFVDNLKSGLQAVKEVFKSAFQWVQDTVLAPFQKKLDSILSFIENIINKMKQIGGSAVSSVKGLFGRATGGPVTANRPYIVGEKGPEMFVPQSYGSITPNYQMAGGGGVVVNISGNSFMGTEDMAEKVGDKIIRIIKNNQRL